MGSRALASTALLLCLNLVFFTMVSSTYAPCPPPPSPTCMSCGQTPPTSPSGQQGGGPSTVPTTPMTPVPSSQGKCPLDILKLGACANVLGGLLNAVLGSQANSPCCSLVQGLTDLDAAVCLCTAIKANILGINLNVPVSLSLLLNNCGKGMPSGFQCA